MATLAELTRQQTDLDTPQINHLQRLIGDWGMLADLCFSDLLLYVPTPDGRWLVVAQVRPVTGQTLYFSDWVGAEANEQEAALVAAAYETGDLVEGEASVESLPEPTRMLAVPIRRDGVTIAVMTREWSARVGRQRGELERTYLSIFERFAVMLREGTFPFEARRGAAGMAPRVGDGVIVLDEDARVRYASPNAVSALHRVGITVNLIGLRLAELGFNDGAVRSATERREPAIEEIDQTGDVTLLTYAIPILAGGQVTGAILLLRDVTELRRRDRLLLSKDATIREIHHRVKNNLQTISSLLRLQARRLSTPDAKAAVNESVRRIRTIALVHETLSREAGDDVAFTEIVRPLLRLVEDGLQSPDRPIRFSTQGDGGKLPAIIASPLSVVLTELLQNSVEHGFPEGSVGGSVTVVLDNDGTHVHLRVVDNGVGIAPDFDLDQATGLGLVIVRTLVTTELAGTISMRPATPEDIAAAGLPPAARGNGSVTELSVPSGAAR